MTAPVHRAQQTFHYLAALQRALALGLLVALLCGLLMALFAATPARAQGMVEPATVLGQPVHQVSVGYDHACALTAAGAVLCWGYNAYGQLGDGTTTRSLIPQPVSGLASGVVAIAAGSQHTCALTTAGAVRCWGDSSVGQLGNGNSGIGAKSTTPQPVIGLGSGIAALVAGNAHTCALTAAGAMVCWGDSSVGQLGNGTSGTGAGSATPQSVTGLSSGVASMAAGPAQTCAVTTAGAALCWGQNDFWQLGNGTTSDADTPQPVSGMGSGTAALGVGGSHGCALTTAGAVWCWGSMNTGGATGSTPQPVTSLSSGVQALSVGISHSCALTTAGTLQCWGINSRGQLGNGGTSTASQPVASQITGVAAVHAGLLSTCAVTTAGALQCWGDNAKGQLGNGTTTNASSPQPVAVLGGAVKAGSLVARSGSTCALSAIGGVYCWGDGGYTPQPVLGLGLETGVTSLALGRGHACAVTSTGAVQCWGDNTNGQLGNGNTSGPVTGLPGAAQAVSAGNDHSCALIAGTGAVYCWGMNFDGQLGDGTTTHAPTAQAVQNLAGGAKAIAAGMAHTCAVTMADALVCWGSNSDGQLGNANTGVAASTPQAVSGLASGVAAVALHSNHSCALTTGGAVKCWGRNDHDELGDLAQNVSDTPQNVPGLASEVAAIATSAQISCAVSTAGALSCWGGNSDGQLGNGSTTATRTPTAVTGLGNGVQAVAAGGLHACALSTGGVLRCWGLGSFGRLGNGGSGTTAEPVLANAGQSIDFPTPSPLPAQGTSTTTLAATATSGMAVQFSTWTPGVCTVSGTTLTARPGMVGRWCGVRAVQDGGQSAITSNGPGYAAAPPQLRLLLVQPSAPGAPTAVTAGAGDARATVRWTAPADDGGSALTGYTVSAVQDASKTCSVTTGSPLPTTCTVLGLVNGTPYTFTVKATNAAGNSAPSAATTPAVVPEGAGGGGGGGPAGVTINSSGTTTITDPTQPVTVGAGAAGAVIALPGTGTTPVTLQLAVNGQSMSVTALPGTQLQVAQVKGQTVLVLVVLQGSASMTSTAPGQPMSLAGEVLLSSGAAGTRIDAQPLAVAVVSGSLVPPNGSLPELGGKGLLAGERLQVDAQGKLVSIALGSIQGQGTQPGDGMVFASLPAALSVDGNAFARIGGALARLSGASLAQGLEVAPSGVLMLRDGAQVFQLLPVQPVTIDARLPDGLSFTPLGLLRWVHGGVVVQFAPAVADLAGLAGAITTALPGATLKLGAEGVLQLGFGGQTYVLRPDWTGAGTAAGTPQIGVDEQGRIVFQIGSNGPRQLLLPALLNATQANAILTTALPGSVLAVQADSSEGALTLTLAGRSWRLVPQWVLPGNQAAQAAPWRIGADGLLYLQLGNRVQGVRIVD